MTIEQKAKAYDQALERAREVHRNEDDKVSTMEFLFPELKESADEKTRGDIISLVNEFWERIGSINPEYSSRSRMIDWLEKQKFTQKDVDDAWLKGMCDAKDELEKQKPAWSEEDEKMLDEIIDFFENGTVKLQHDLSLYASWLISIKQRIS